VVGFSFLPGTNVSHAFLWQGGVLTDLNGLLSNGAGWTLTVATAVNPGGQIVGYGTDPDGLTHAFLLTPDPSPARAFRVVAPAAAQVLPPDDASQPDDRGMVTFPGGATLVLPGDPTVTATDTVGGVTGSATVTVTAGPSRNGRLAPAAAPDPEGVDQLFTAGWDASGWATVEAVLLGNPRP
jgi:probable HAF family extracellular repeat protein